MSRTLNLAANPLRVLLLLLALAVLGMIVVGFNATSTPLYNSGTHLTGPSGPAPNLGSQAPANSMDNQAAQPAQPAPTTRVITRTNTQPPYVAPASTTNQATPTTLGAQECPKAPPGRQIAVCANP